MKKVILFISIALMFCSERTKAQTDTMAVLQNIVANKSVYIGQTFSNLLNQLPVEIKYFSPSRPFSNNRYKEPSTRFSFCFPNNPNELNKTYPRLVIYWQPYLNRNASLSLFNSTKGAWSSTIALHYGTAIISDIILERN